MVIRELINLIGFKVNDKELKKTEDRFEKFKKRLLLVGTAAAAGIIAIGVAAVKSASKMEALTTQFEVMLGSTEKATKMMEELETFSARTPFQLPDLAQGTQNLLSFGVAEEDVIGTMRMLGDAALGNTEKLKGLVLAYGKVQTKGKVSMEEINMIAEKGVPIISTLQKQLGVTETEFFKLISAGTIGKREMTIAFQTMTSEGGKFYQGMLKSSKDFTGVLSTLKDVIGLVLASIGKEMLPMLKEYAIQITEIAMKVREWVKLNKDELAEGFKKLFGIIKTGLKFLFFLGKTLFWIISSPLRKVILGIAIAFGVWKVATYAVIIAQKVLMATMVIGKFLQFVKLIFMIAKAKGIWTAAQWALNVAMTANPIGVIIMGVAALIAAIIAITVAIIKFRKKIVEFFKLLWQGIMVFKNVISIFMPFLWLPLTIIKNWKKILSFFKDFKGNIKSIFSGISEWIIYLFTHPIEAIKQLWFNLVDFFKGLFTGFLQEAIDLYNNVVGFFTGDKGKKTQKEVAKEIATTTNNNQKTQNNFLDTTINMQGGTPGSQNSNRQIAQAAGSIFNLQLKKVLIENGGL